MLSPQGMSRNSTGARLLLVDLELAQVPAPRDEGGRREGHRQDQEPPEHGPEPGTPSLLGPEPLFCNLLL